MPDASLMLPCSSVDVPPGKLTDNEVGVLLLDYDSKLTECQLRNQKLVEFIRAGETPPAKR